MLACQLQRYEGPTLFPVIISVKVSRLQLYETSCQSTNSLKVLELPHWLYEGRKNRVCWGCSCHVLSSSWAQPHSKATWGKKEKSTVCWCGRGEILREERRKTMSRDAPGPPTIAVASLKEWRREASIRRYFREQSKVL